MASNSKTYLIHEESLVCGICLECWVEKDPRILNCQHTFCMDCLQVLPIVDGCITCPSCKDLCNIPKGQLIHLRKNILQSSFEKVPMDNDFCLLHKKEASLFCETHQTEKICTKCFHENHLNCKISTMESRKEKSALIKKYLRRDNSEKDNVLKEIKIKEDEYIKTINEWFNGIKMNINEIFKLRNDQIRNIIKQNLAAEKLANLVENFMENKVKVELSNINLDYEIKNQQNNNKFEENNDDVRDIEVVEVDSFKGFIDDVRRHNISCTLISRGYKEKIKHPTIFYLTFVGAEENSIFISSSELNEEDITNIGKIILRYPSIQAVEISNLKLTMKSLSHIFHGLSASANVLKHILLNDCGLNDKMCELVTKILRPCTQLEILNLANNKRTKKGLINILISLNPTLNNILKEIDFSFCCLNESQSKDIGKLLLRFKSIESAGFKGNDDMKRGLLNIFEGLQKSSNTLKRLNFSQCQINELQSKEFGKLLKSCSNIQSLDISLNQQMNNGFTEILNGLKESSNKLKELNLSSLNITNLQLKELGELLLKCQHFEFLNLSHNINMQDEIIEVVNGLSNCKQSLKHLNLSFCALTEQKKETLKHFFPNIEINL